MSIPSTIQYPSVIDTDQNLFLVHDSLRMTLAQDYNPGDTTIYVQGDLSVLSNFPPTGLITLTEQCSAVQYRVLSFYYSSVSTNTFTFSGLELLPEFTNYDSVKPKGITDVTMNVMDLHHNMLKDAIIAIEEFIGTQGTIDSQPLGKTLEGRINFLRKLVLSPKAYFTVNKTIGLVPLTCTFTDLSFRTGTDGTTGTIEYLWNFGDNTISNVSSVISLPSSISMVVPSCADNVLIEENESGNITKTYCTPGVFDVTLTVTNKFGSDTITIPGLINARVGAPEPAFVQYVPDTSTQAITQTGTITNGIYSVPPVVRAPVGTLLTLQVPSGPNPSNSGYSYAGEQLNGSGHAIDPIVSYTWNLSDDLSHSNLNSVARASYSVGGIYDMVLRTDTSFGAYRITVYENSIDIIENTNLWLFNFINSDTVTVFEFGLISETFKTAGLSDYTVSIDTSFLENLSNSPQLLREFNRNTGFVPLSAVGSGNQSSDALLFYASGRSSSETPASETIDFISFNGFFNTYDTTLSSINRPWNWLNFNSTSNAYFLFGEPTSAPAPFTSPSNANMMQYNLSTLTGSNSVLTTSNFQNGAQELLTNLDQFTPSGNSVYGNISIYRSAWQNNTGYFLRNSNIGDFFQIKSFYQTSGTLSDPVQTVTKLNDMLGPTKIEGELLAMTPGLFFFNNSGAISAYNTTSYVWETNGPGINSLAFSSLQDQTISGYDNLANTLLAVSDGDNRAYLSYDYSVRAFIKFSAIDLTFSTITNRPAGTQWIMGIF